MTNQQTGEQARLIKKFARLARETVTVGDQVQVWIDGVTPDSADPCSLKVFDQDGVPNIACRDTHPIAVGMGRRVRIVIRRQTLEADVRVEMAGLTVVVEGRLQRAVRGIAPLAAGMVAMAVDISAVIVEQQPATGPLRTIQVPVASYLAVDIDPLVIHQMAVAAHYNTIHERQLRDCVARLTRSAIGDIVAATVTELTAEAVTLSWIDYDGARSATIHFARRATEPDEMGLLLHECLTNVR